MLVDLSLTPEEFRQVVTTRREDAVVELRKWVNRLNGLISGTSATNMKLEDIRNHIDMIHQHFSDLKKAESDLSRLQDDIDDRV